MQSSQPDKTQTSVVTPHNHSMKKYIEQGKQALDSLTVKVSDEFNSGIRIIKEVVGDLPVFVSSERTANFATLYDEKHYFVIPFALSEAGFTLHTMRCLPDGVPEINDLPKRRVFHLPNEHYEASLRQHMIQSAQALSTEKMGESKSTLERLADDIDALDTKLTYGMLLIGGLTAIFNPLVGAGIAAKALLPGVGGLINKYGLRPFGQKMSRQQMEKEARNAAEMVIKQFSEANTHKVINPILQELELALRTTEAEHDPMLTPLFEQGSIPDLENERWRELTEKAIFHVYKDIYADQEQHLNAQLGPEDIRWFKAMFTHLN